MNAIESLKREARNMTKSVLSIQSHVCHGYVGSKAAIFPLQTQGWEVDNINTVDFSNHTGYGFVKGSSMSVDGIANLFQGLRDTDQCYDAVISGYIPNDALIREVRDFIVQEKSKNPKLMYLLDPVMGDEGHIYVEKSCIEEYKNILQEGIVDIVTPNQFEVELLCGFPINDTTNLKRALSMIHEKYKVRYVIVTSLSPKIKISPTSKEDSIACAVSTTENSDICIFSVPLIKSYFTGVGDLFSALLLDKMHHNLIAFNKSGWTEFQTISLSVNQVLTIITKTLKLTYAMGIKKFNTSQEKQSTHTTLEGEMNDKNTMKFFELKIVQSKDFFDYRNEGEFETTII